MAASEVSDRGGKDSPLLNSLMLPQQEMDNRPNRRAHTAGVAYTEERPADKRRQQARYWVPQIQQARS